MRRPLHLLLSALPLAAGAWVQGTPAGTEDPIATLQADLAAGKKTLPYEPKQGYLRALLKELRIDPSSQTLVFSKTSLQTDFISRKTPRAIYFNDEVYVGWIPGAPLIEIMSVHPTRGIVFTSLPNVAPKGNTKAAFKSESEDCARCHGGRVPRLFANSVLVAPSGYPRVFSRGFDATPSLPLRQRWGGWYVTGTHGGGRHMGNVLSLGTDEKPTLDIEKGANVTDLRPYFDTTRYLVPHSDIVALLVMESQMEVQNAITRAGRTARPRRDGAPASPDDVAEGVDTLVEALLGSGEAKLASPVAGTTGFATTYAARSPRDPKGRSLFELDLRTRVYRYGCSPLIYSRSFEKLPDAARQGVYARLKAILSGADKDPRFSHLTPEDRQTLLELFRDTMPEFARFLGVK